MIKDLPNGTFELTFHDWSHDMTVLSFQLYELPKRPGNNGPRTHHLGIDRLSKLRLGDMAVFLLLQHVNDFEYCPTEKEVIRMGKVLVVAASELIRIRKQGGWCGPTASGLRRTR